MNIRIGILGYGNLGRGVECAGTPIRSEERGNENIGAC